MRPIITLQDVHQCERLAAYLKDQGIENEVEVIKNTDWGDPAYGDMAYKIWVYDENVFEQSLAIATDFQNDPEGLHFQVASQKVPLQAKAAKTTKEPSPNSFRTMRFSTLSQAPLSGVTLALLIICSLLFLATALFSSGSKEAGIYSALPFFYSPLKKELLFDYPQAFEILDQLISSFGIDALKDTAQLPKSALALIQKYNETPYWKGIYDKVVEHLQNPGSDWNFSAPLFEKIRQGEVWRFFTPALLHADFFHILFNMIWLIVLGKQLELRMGSLRFLLFVAIAAFITNLAQYLVGGSSFLGFSGVLCAMLSFVWIRQRYAAWEGYFLQPSTMGFMMAFLGLMLLLQTISFYAETAFHTTIAPPIANTAHMSGLLIGLLMGKLDFFAWK